jgi:pimeloyl-ACP methyl ester carboxylesterase
VASRLVGLLALPVTVPVAIGLGLRSAHRVYHPPRQPNGVTPADRGMPFIATRVVTSRDEVALSVWVIPAPEPAAAKGTVIVSHGMGRNAATVLSHATMLRAAGFHVVAYDLRNHGDSGRDRALTGMAARYTADLADVVAFAEAHPKLSGDVSVLAFSFSTWPALHILREPGIELAAVVCEGGPALDIGAGLRRLAELRRSRLPAPLRGAVPFAALRASLDLGGQIMLAVRAWPTDLDRTSTRTLFIAGGRDQVIPPPGVEALVRHYAGRPAGERVSYWLAPRAIHLNALRLNRSDYTRIVPAFLAGEVDPPRDRRRRAEVLA